VTLAAGKKTCMTNPCAVAHGAAKTSLVSAAKSVPVAHGERGIRMNVVLCCAHATEAHRASFLNQDGIAQCVLSGRVGVPDEIASAIVFLASPSGSRVSGQNLTVDGSLTGRFLLPLPDVAPNAAG
jgi:3-oxoacyl-[acyl-carrier protein] reductase